VGVERHKEWNPFILWANGHPAEGKAIKIQVAKQSMPLGAAILRLEPGREMIWAAHLPLGLIKPQYSQLIEPAAGSGTARSLRGGWNDYLGYSSSRAALSGRCGGAGHSLVGLPESAIPRMNRAAG
jgi:hypothetical protein